jgi:hypothetical protein
MVIFIFIFPLLLYHNFKKVSNFLRSPGIKKSGPFLKFEGAGFVRSTKKKREWITPLPEER